MRRLIIFLLFLIASVWLGLVIVRHPGYLFLVYQPWMVQMPLWFALFGLIVLFVLLYTVINSIDRFQFWSFRFKNWLRIRREHQSYSQTQRGVMCLIEARWKRAEKILLAGINQTVEPLINYLGAAKAALEQEAYDRSDHYIQQAYQAVPNAELTIGLVQAEFEIRQHQLERASATLNRLRDSAPRHPRVLQLLEKVYVRLGDWKQLLALLPSLRKANVFQAEQFEKLEQNVHIQLLKTSATQPLGAIHQIWHDIPRALKKKPDIVLAYVIQLKRYPNTNSDIEQLIRKTLKYDWQPDLVVLYGSLPFDNLNRQLVVVGAWVKIHGEKRELLLTLGTLCARIQLWGRAKDYFERCLAQGPYPEATLRYGQLLDQLGDAEAAKVCYRNGLAQFENNISID